MLWESRPTVRTSLSRTTRRPRHAWARSSRFQLEGSATFLYSYPGGVDPPAPYSITNTGSKLYWIDPESGPASETQILAAPKNGTGPISIVVDGPGPVDGTGLTTDGAKLYAADAVQGRVFSMNLDGSNVSQLGGSRYGGFFDTEHQNSIATSGGTLFVADSGRLGVDSPQVVSIPTTGGSFTTLFAGSPFGYLSGIAVVGDTIYLADSVAKTIWDMPITGGTPQALVTDNDFGALGNLTYFNNALYVVDEAGAGGVDIWKISLSSVPEPGSLTLLGLGGLLDGLHRTGRRAEERITGRLASGARRAAIPPSTAEIGVSARSIHVSLSTQACRLGQDERPRLFGFHDDQVLVPSGPDAVSSGLSG